MKTRNARVRPRAVRKHLFYVPALAVAAILIGCGSDEPTGSGSPTSEPAVGYLGYRGCKSTDSISQSAPGAAQECLVYSYDGESLLEISHVNAVFNCCPDSLIGSISLTGDGITMTESGEGLCDCLCLYDLDYRLAGVAPGTYTLSVAGIADLEVTVDLAAEPSGRHCVDRSGYPWSGPEASGETSWFLGCKAGRDAGTGPETPPIVRDCIEYRYDGVSVLTLLHTNGQFNCCVDDLPAEITVEGNRIRVRETEVLTNGSGCRCLCLYDLEHRIEGLPPGWYEVRVEEPYVGTEEEPLAFPVALFEATAGRFCVDRPGWATLTE